MRILRGLLHQETSCCRILTDTWAQIRRHATLPCKQIGPRPRNRRTSLREFSQQLRAVGTKHERIGIMPGFLWIRVGWQELCVVARPEPAFNLLLVPKAELLVKRTPLFGGIQFDGFDSHMVGLFQSFG